MDNDQHYDHLKEELISSERIFDGKVIKVDHSRVKLPNGAEADREIVYHKGAVCLIAVQDNQMLFVRQYRVSTKEFLLEIPAGKIEEGEAPIETARKELREEVGGTAGELKKIQSFYVSPGFSNEYVHLYEAADVSFKPQELDDDEFLDIVKIDLDQLRVELESGAFKDAKTIVAVQHVLATHNL